MSEGCARCGHRGASMLACGRCRIAKYCGASCQRAHWSDHKQSCRRPDQAPSFGSLGLLELSMKAMGLRHVEQIEACVSELSTRLEAAEKEPQGFRPVSVAVGCTIYGQLLVSLGRVSEAVDFARRVRSRLEQQSERPTEVIGFLLKAVTWLDELDKSGIIAGERVRGPRLKERQEMALRAVTISDRMGIPNQALAEVLCAAANRLSVDSPSRALPLALRAVQISTGEVKVMVSSVLADCYVGRGQVEEGLRVMRKAIRYSEENGIQDERRLCELFGGLAEMLQGVGRYEEAMPYALRARALARNLHDYADRRAVDVLADLYEKTAQLDKALEIDRLIMKECGGTSAGSTFRLARHALSCGRRDYALPLLRWSVSNLSSVLGDMDPIWIPRNFRVMELLRDVLQAEGSLDEAADITTKMEVMMADWDRKHEHALQEVRQAMEEHRKTQEQDDWVTPNTMTGRQEGGKKKRRTRR